MTPLEEACIRPVLERIGIPLERREMANEPWFGWDGKALNLNAPFGDALHEAAHWLLSPPHLRALSDFGLESYEEAGDSDKFEWATDQEEAASLLGILMERHLGLPWENTFEFHQWRDKGPNYIVPIVRRLRAAGHLRGLTPTCFLEGR